MFGDGLIRIKMTVEEKQIQLLNRNYTNIEHYKSLRLRIPTIFGGMIIALSGYVITSDEIIEVPYSKLIFSILIILISIFGIIIYYFIQKQYKDIAEDIYYLQEKLEMVGEDFYKKDKGIIHNNRILAPRIFLAGYLSMISAAIIGLVLIII